MSAQFRNTSKTYGLVAIWLHWIVAAAFLANYAVIYFREWFLEAEDPLRRTLFSTHTAIGTSVLVIIGLRVIWKLTSKTPQPVPGTKLEHILAHSVHILLYIVMIGLPLTGYLGTSGASKLFFLIEIPSFKNTGLFATVIEGWMGLSWEAWEKPIDWLHKTGGAYGVSLLIAAHISAALFHHLIRKDQTLIRMISPCRMQKEKDPST